MINSLRWFSKLFSQHEPEMTVSDQHCESVAPSMSYAESRLGQARETERARSAALAEAQQQFDAAVKPFEEAERKHRLGEHTVPPNRLRQRVIDAQKERDRCSRELVQARIKTSEAINEVDFEKRAKSMRQLPASRPPISI